MIDEEVIALKDKFAPLKTDVGGKIYLALLLQPMSMKRLSVLLYCDKRQKTNTSKYLKAFRKNGYLKVVGKDRDSANPERRGRKEILYQANLSPLFDYWTHSMKAKRMSAKDFDTLEGIFKTETEIHETLEKNFNSHILEDSLPFIRYAKFDVLEVLTLLFESMFERMVFYNFHRRAEIGLKNCRDAEAKAGNKYVPLGAVLKKTAEMLVEDFGKRVPKTENPIDKQLQHLYDKLGDEKVLKFYRMLRFITETTTPSSKVAKTLLLGKTAFGA